MAVLLTATFDQVHLPPATIDAVRTMVSLPLLRPEAFVHGVLKDHGMTGCLLFGPPGTGKTLVVRALAGEAGCRMIAVAPADIMDMVSLTLQYSRLKDVHCIPSMWVRVRSSCGRSSTSLGVSRHVSCS